MAKKKIESMKIYELPVGKIKVNPDNPRFIKDQKYDELLSSINSSPAFMNSNPVKLDLDGMIIGGNMRYRACRELGWDLIPCVYFTEEDAKRNNEARKAKGEKEATYEEQRAEFIVKDNLSYGDWDPDLLANQYDIDQLDVWGLEIPGLDPIETAEEGDEIELDQSVQMEPPKEYVLIMCEPNSVDWEELKELLKLKMVRRGGYKKGSDFDSVGLERVLWYDEFIKRLKDVDSGSK